MGQSSGCAYGGFAQTPSWVASYGTPVQRPLPVHGAGVRCRHGIGVQPAQWLDPATGRWISQDPGGFAAGDMDVYRCVGNNPLNAIDPSGLQDGPITDEVISELRFCDYPEVRIQQTIPGGLTGRPLTFSRNAFRKTQRFSGIYSDLLLHDMGARLDDAAAYSVFVGAPPRAEGAQAPDRPSTASASIHEWRTPPLWGLRDSGPYLHDGRATSIDQAIGMHAGQGASSARRYAELSPARKRHLATFLRSLVAPAANLTRNIPSWRRTARISSDICFGNL